MTAVIPPSFTFKWAKLPGHEFDHSSPSVSRLRMSAIIPLFLLRSFVEWKVPILTCKLQTHTKVYIFTKYKFQTICGTVNMYLNIREYNLCFCAMLNTRTIFCQFQRVALFAVAGIPTVVYIKTVQLYL
jgi:hypothetical protein